MVQGFADLEARMGAKSPLVVMISRFGSTASWTFDLADIPADVVVDVAR